jgi:hypothetical protein
VNFENKAVSGTGESGDNWEEKIIRQTQEAYGLPNPAQYATRDKALREVLKVQEKMDR